MISANFVVLGETSIASELGKKGAETDMTFYERKSGDRIFTFIVPSGFPEKIQPLVQAIALCEHAILNVTKIDKPLGEVIVALDSIGIGHGFIIADGFEEQLRSFIKGTVLDGYSFVDIDELKRQIEGVKEISAQGRTKVVCDAAFEVKGIGAVVLGVVKSGVVKTHDELQIYPADKKVLIKSVQMHDDDVESSASPGRVGLALKGVEAKDVSRGDIIAGQGLHVAAEATVEFEKSRFYKTEMKPGAVYHVCVGLQVVPASMESGRLRAEKKLAFETGETFLLLDLNSPSTRIVGKGRFVG